MREEIKRLWPDAALPLALVLAALLVRLPFLYLVPRFTDEMLDVNTAWKIAQGLASPLSTAQSIYGPLYPGFLGLLLRIFPTPLLPRALAAVLGALTAAATFFAGRVLYNRAVGFLAGALTATSSTLIVVNSHISYENSFTPLFATLALAGVVRARRTNSAAALAWSGAALALAIQTHPVAAALVPPLLIWFFLPRAQWAWFRRAGTYVAGLVTLLVYAPVIVLVFPSVESVREWLNSRSYAVATDHSPGALLANLQNMIVELARMLGAIYRDYRAPREYFLQPLALAYAVLVPLALWLALRRGGALLPGVLAAALLIIPYFNNQYGTFPYFTRYLAFLLPFIYLAVAALIVESREWIHTRLKPKSARAAALGLGALCVAALVVAPLWPTLQFYTGQVGSGRSNTLFLDIASRIESEPAADILVDESLRAGEFPSGGNLFVSFQTWLAFTRRPVRSVALLADIRPSLCTAHESFLIAADEAAARLDLPCEVKRVVGARIPTRPGRPDLSFSLFVIGANRLAGGEEY